MSNNVREKVQRIIEQRGLCSYMNTTKWDELIAAVREEMPFPPPYRMKFVTEELDELEQDFCEDVYYLCYWCGENFPTKEYYFNIEWLKVRPRYLEHRGKLVEPGVIDASSEFESILRKYNIPFELEDGTYCIYGYK